MTWILLAVIFLLEVWIINWANRAKPDARMRAKYPMGIIHRVMFMRRRSWVGRIEMDDIPHLQRYRYRFHVFLLSLAVLFVTYLLIVFLISVR